MRIALFFLFLCLASAALAESSEDVRKELSSTLSDIKQSGERQKELARKTEALQAELASLQKAMADMGKDMLEQEEALSSSEDKLAILEQQRTDKTHELERRQGELSGMISAMVKLRQMPPEAVIAMPGKLEETLATARALSVVTETIGEEARSLKGQLRELALLEDKIRRGREIIVTRKTALAARRTELAAKMKERGALVETLGGQEHEEEEHIAGLVAKSQNLKELMNALQKSGYGWTGRRQENERAPRPRQSITKRQLRSFARARGHISLPAAGKIVSHYGNSETSASFSKGIMIETRASADVVAPFDGEVVFAGPFRDYGRMVIIRHSGDYHTLISGMEEIDCTPGQYLLEGEPIGSMGARGTNKLYLELREEGKPIDPMDWVKG